jgi:hypothetical protein
MVLFVPLWRCDCYPPFYPRACTPTYANPLRDPFGVQTAQADDEGSEEEGEDGEEGEGGSGSAVDGMSYDQLLALGDRIGDVAKERWALRSAAFIATLPHFVHKTGPCEGEHSCEHPLSSSANAIGESLDRCGTCGTCGMCGMCGTCGMCGMCGTCGTCEQLV